MIIARPDYSEERFLFGFTPEPMSGCWLWAERCSKKGYGEMYFRGQTMRAHRVAWILYRGPIPPGLLVCHKCDTPPCVNPDHLFLGTHADNAADCIAKGRWPHGDTHIAHRRPEVIARGEKHWNAKLSDEKVKQVFALRESGLVLLAIARAVGCSKPHISKILSGKARNQHALRIGN